MNKKQIISMIEKRIPKELLLDELIKVKKTLGLDILPALKDEDSSSFDVK